MTTSFVRRVGAAAACGVLTMLVCVPPAFADSTRNRQWHLAALDVADAQKISKGAGVTVAVIDTGVNADHRDLTGNVLPGVDFIATGTKGWVDTNGHGTAMAGLIAGHGHGPGNADGALGIAPAAKILPIRVLDDPDRPNLDIPKAIDDAVSRGANVISMSFVTTNSDDLDRALESAAKADVVLIAGSGNHPENVLLQYPAKYRSVVAVGATGRDGKLSKVTVTGKEMAITAPGDDIASTSNTGAYLEADGTSNSTAIVAGAAALVRSKYPDLSATEVVHRLTATATDKGAPGRDSDYGFGELNLVAALTADVPPATAQPSGATTAPATATSAEAAPPAGSAVRVDWVAVGIALAVVALVIVLIIVLIVWLIVRSRRLRSPPGAYPPPDQRAGESRRDTFRP
jgi:type VII secretion-associated serine protease mycosin